MRERWGRQVPLVILPIDEYTGNVIRDPALEVSVAGLERPLIKPDGFRVFSMGQPGPGAGNLSAEKGTAEFTVTLRGRHYQRMQVVISSAGLDEKDPVAKIYIKPDRSYPFLPGAIFIEGTLPEHARLWVAKADGPGALRLRADVQAGDDKLQIYRGGMQSFVGDSYLMLGQGREEREWVTLQTSVDAASGIYQLNSPICHEYTRTVAKLYKSICYESDVLGSDCFLALTGKNGEETEICCRLDSDMSFRVRGGETLHLDFSTS